MQTVIVGTPLGYLLILKNLSVYYCPACGTLTDCPLMTIAPLRATPGFPPTVNCNGWPLPVPVPLVAPIMLSQVVYADGTDAVHAQPAVTVKIRLPFPVPAAENCGVEGGVEVTQDGPEAPA